MLVNTLLEAFAMPTNDGSYDYYENVEVGLAGMQRMLQAMGCWTVVQDVSTSNVIKPASYKEKNQALIAKYWSKVSGAKASCHLQPPHERGHEWFKMSYTPWLCSGDSTSSDSH